VNKERLPADIKIQAYALMPGTFTDVSELLIPELQRRGIFWNDYAVPGGTYRENLTETKGQCEPRPDHPAAAMIWRAPEIEAEVKANGSHEALTNGWHGDVDGKAEDHLDPISMQFC
jgi:hypothetical protein